MDKSNYKNMWVHVEHDGEKIHPVTLELCCEIRKLCDQSGDRLIAVSAGELPESELDKLRDCGADGVIIATGKGYARYSTEAYSDLYVQLVDKYKPSAVFIGATVNGRDFAPHFAACLETGCTSDATELIYNPETKDIEFVEPAAGGKIMAVITIPVLRPQVGTIRPGTFKTAPSGKREIFEIIRESIGFDEEKIRTKLLGGKLAGTRPVVDRELLPNKLQVGQSGVMVKPKLYIGFGVSGAVNHVTGVDAELFIAVNKDANAPIFNYCDYGVVGDMDEVCDHMIEMLKK